MPIWLIAIIAFVIAMVVIAYLQRGNYLEKLQMHPGEEIIFEDPKCKFTSQQKVGKKTVFTMGFVRVTNMRIITTQGVLCSKKHIIRHIIYYKDAPVRQDEGDSLLELLQRGHQLFHASPESITIERNEDGKASVTIKPHDEIGGDESFLKVGEVVIYPSDIALYEKLFG